MNEVTQLMKNHTSVRKYLKEAIPKEKLYALIEAAQYAATSKFVQAYSIINVTDENMLRKIARLSGNAHVAKCGAFLAFCADIKRLEIACEMNGVTMDAQTTDHFIVATIDASLVAQNLVLACESEGYGTCFIGGVRTNIEKISELLELPDKVALLFGLTIGVRGEENEVKPRLPLEAIVHENTYQSKLYPGLLNDYDEVMKDYYSKRSNNQKEVTWTKSMGELFSVSSRKQVGEFLRKKGFLIDE